MKPVPESWRSLRFPLAALGALSILATAFAAEAQPRPPQRPGGPDNLSTFEVLSVDPEGWVVTARDVETGSEFSFRLPPEAFRGRRFTADLSGAQVGQRVSVTGEPGVRMNQAQLERPLGTGPRSESSPGGPLAEGNRDPGRFAPPEGPGKYAAQDPQRDPSRFETRRSPHGQRGGGPAIYEVLEFDPATRTATVRGEDGETLSLEVDPAAFVGYRFRAAVGNLRLGQGFELVADNERPMTDCCIVRERPRQ